jgi:(p)ppGpp synthase/HD superfamily hydrolase
VSHLARVALTVSSVFGCHDPLVLAAALLHDTIEDTTTDYDDLEKHFGREVASIVVNLTQNNMLPESDREREYYARLGAACWRTKIVKLADIYDNICDAGSYPPEKREEKQARFRAKGRRLLALLTPEDLAREPVARGAAALRALVSG